MVLDGAHLRLGLNHSDARFHTCDGHHGAMATARLQEQGIVLAERQVHVRFLQEAKTRRQDSHNDGICPVQDYGLSECLRARAIAVSPQAIADDDHWRPAAPVFLWRELAAKTWHDAEGTEEAGSHFDAVEMFRRSRAGQVIALV